MRAAEVLHVLFLSRIGAVWPRGEDRTNKIRSRTPVRDDGSTAGTVVGIGSQRVHLVVVALTDPRDDTRERVPRGPHDPATHGGDG